MIRAATIAALVALFARTQADTLVDTVTAANGEGGTFEGELDTLIAALTKADLVDTLAGLEDNTVFAPPDSAFEAVGLEADDVDECDTNLLTNLLTYHLVDAVVNSTAFVSTANRNNNSVDTMSGVVLNTFDAEVNGGDPEIATTSNQTVGLTENLDIETSGIDSLIHVVDAVMAPADLPQTAVAAGPSVDLNSLLELITKAEFASEISAYDDGELECGDVYTVFAPLDSVFVSAGLTSADIDSLTKSQAEDILGAHVVEGYYTAEDLDGVTELTTIGGDLLEIDAVAGTITVTDGKDPNGVDVPMYSVTLDTTDIETLNGVIHTFDGDQPLYPNGNSAATTTLSMVAVSAVLAVFAALF